LQVDLSGYDVFPCGGVGVLEIGHEDIGAGVEGVDHHLPVDRAGDLDPAVAQGFGGLRHGPHAVADSGRLGEEPGPVAGVETGLTLSPGRQ